MSSKKKQSKELVGRKQQRDTDAGLTLFERERNSILARYASFRHKVHHLGQHTRMIDDVMMTPDDQFILTCSSDSTAKLWDRISGRHLVTYQGHTSCVLHGAITPDGSQLITGSSDHTVKIWNIFTGECTGTIEIGSQIESLCLTPDGRYLLTGEYRAIKQWNIETRECLREIKDGSSVEAMQVSSDGKYFATGGGDGTAKYWHLASGQCLLTYEGHDKRITSVSLAPDGGHLLTCSHENRTAKMWHVRTGRCLRTFEQVFHRGRGGIFTNDGQNIIVGGMEDGAKLMDINTGKCVRIFNHEYVDCMAISHDGSYLVTSSSDCDTKVWDMDTGECIKTLGQAEAWRFISYSIASDKRHILTLEEQGKILVVKKWDRKNGKVLKSCLITPSESDGRMQCVYDSKYLVLRGNTSVTIYDLDTAQCIRRFDTEDYFISVCLIPGGHRLAMAERPGVKIWDIEKEVLLLDCGGMHVVGEMYPTPDGQHLLVRKWPEGRASNLPETVLLDLDTRQTKLLNILRTGELIYLGGHVTPDGKQLIVHLRDGITIVGLHEDIDSCWVYIEPPGKSYMDSKKYTDGRLSPNKKYIIASGDEGVDLWDFEKQKFIKTIAVGEGDAQFMSDTTLITCKDDTLLFRSFPDGELLGELYATGHGFLWTASKEGTTEDIEQAAPWFWTDRKDLITVFDCDANGKDIRVVDQEDSRFKEYFGYHNRPDIVMARANNDTDKYRKLIADDIRGKLNYAVDSQRISGSKSHPNRTLPGSCS